MDFNPQGPRGPRRAEPPDTAGVQRFQSTRPSRASTLLVEGGDTCTHISIHKALAGLDIGWQAIGKTTRRFQSTRPSRASTLPFQPEWHMFHNFNPQGPRGPRQQNYPTIPPHPPNFLCIMSSPPYFNLLHPFTQPIFTAFPLFFRCESPKHFMLAWHSHLV